MNNNHNNRNNQNRNVNNNRNNQNRNVNNNRNNQNKKLRDYIDEHIDEIGILDTEGRFSNPLTGQSYTDRYLENVPKWVNLPAYQDVTAVIDEITNNQVSLIISGTGSGKTVLIPKYALHYLKYNGKVASTNPKTVPSISNATFGAMCLDVELGQEVGYAAGGNKKMNDKTKLIYCTDGWLSAKILGDDPYLEKSGIDVVIVDEVHERKVNIDLLLLLLKNVSNKRPEFRIILVSATIDHKPFKLYYDAYSFKKLELSKATNYPIEDNYATVNSNEKEYVTDGVKRIIKILKDNPDEDKGILFFLTSRRECDDACKLLHELIAKENTDINPYCAIVASGIKDKDMGYAEESDLYKQLQGVGDKKGSFNRKIVMATNSVESSITIKNLKYVIDSGYELVSSYNPDTMAKALKKQFTSQAQMKQRKGRCGRQEEGVFYGLYTEKQFKSQPAEPTPDILKDDITDTLLDFLCRDDIPDLHSALELMNKLLSTPKESYLRSSIFQLLSLDAIEFIPNGGGYDDSDDDSDDSDSDDGDDDDNDDDDNDDDDYDSDGNELSEKEKKVNKTKKDKKKKKEKEKKKKEKAKEKEKKKKEKDKKKNKKNKVDNMNEKKNDKNNKVNISTFPNAVITEMGKKMSLFQRCDLKLSRMLLASKDVEKKYNVKCITEVASLAGVIIAFDGKLGNMFEKPFDNQGKAKFQKLLKGVATKYGDLMTMFKMFEKYKQIKIKIQDGNARDEELNKFCRKYYLHSNHSIGGKWQTAIKFARNFKSSLLKSVKIDIENLKNNKSSGKNSMKLNTNEVSNIQMGGNSSKINAIMESFITGYYINLAKYVKINGSKKYLTCFPAKETYNPIEMDSVTHFYKDKADYVIYMELFDGQTPPTKLNTVTVVTEQQVNNLPNHIRDHILRCINYKEEKHQHNQGKQKGKKDKQHQHQQKGKKDKQHHQQQQQKGKKHQKGMKQQDKKKKEKKKKDNRQGQDNNL
jgi:HrpA-like RNA helicase